jgi:hypothetical protein
MEVGFGQMDFPGAPWRPYWKRNLKNERGVWDIEAGEKKLTFGSPHLIFLIPSIIRLPDLKADGEVVSRFRNKDPFLGMRDIRSRH